MYSTIIKLFLRTMIINLFSYCINILYNCIQTTISAATPKQFQAI